MIGDDDRIRNMPQPDGILAWYRGERDPKVVCPRGSHARYDNVYGYDETDRGVIRQRRRLKQSVRDAVDFYSNMKPPHGIATREKWFRDLSRYRLMIAKFPESRSENIAKHIRTISAIRSARHCNSQWRAGISTQPFYVEPNTKFIPWEDVPKARECGMDFYRVASTIPVQAYRHIRKQFERDGRLSGYWSSEYEIDAGAEDCDFEFLFSDPTDEEKITEELVWLKLRY
jgi:hypothetical protein